MLIFYRVSFYLGCLLMAGALVSLWEGFLFYLSFKTLFLEWELYSVYGSMVIMTFLMDWMSLTFMGFVMLISSLVLFYSSVYMSEEKFIYRFIMLVFLFVVSMLLMISSPNMISILLGWDGLGLVSYCLVIFYQNEKSANAGMLTILSNRVGDVAILLSIAWLVNYGSWNFFFVQVTLKESDLFLILFLVVLASMTKSAQIPFSAWLPAAMAAPTPVSALVHSSTLVTAGVYLLIRFSSILNVSNFLFVLGSLTMFMSGLGANFEMDLKKIIALSTLSQLGVMMMTLSLGFYELSFFHLLSHALFKSLLFLCAGVFIHGMGDIQDIRHLGGVQEGCPVSSLYFMGCSLALCGFPFLAGFYSKDAILEVFFMSEMNFFMVVMIIVGTFFTVTYSIRLIFYLYLKNLGLKKFCGLGEDLVMVLPMGVLFILASSGGSMMAWVYFPGYFILLPLLFKLMILIGSLIFSWLILEEMVSISLKMNNLVQSLSYFLGGMWFLPFFSTGLIIPSLKIGAFLVKFLDQGWMEQLGGQGIIYGAMKQSSFLDYVYSLSLKIYFFIFFIMLIFFVSG
uniref:NADH-ubiquinone oxidoreductase chain 5 n=1 Tax=Homidia sp. TaxID=3054010 RepID=A0AAU6PTE9_9HEXA